MSSLVFIVVFCLHRSVIIPPSANAGSFIAGSTELPAYFLYVAQT